MRKITISSRTQINTFHRNTIVIDGHADTFSKLLKEQLVEEDFFQLTTKRHIDYPRLLKGGVTLQFVAVYTPPNYRGTNSTFYSLRMINLILNTIQKSNRKIRLIQSRQDLKTLHPNKLSFIITIEGGLPLNEDIGILELFFRLGVRVLTLTHNPRNSLADGCGEPHPSGLTSFGKHVCKKMNQLGMIIDLAHIARKGFYEAIELSQKPVIVSHTGVRRFYDIPRNLDDEQIRVLAQHKGVLGIFFIPHCLTKPQKHRSHEVPISLILDHFCYVADKFGVDCLGLGSDFDGFNGKVIALEDVSKLSNLTAGLFKRGFNATEIKKILGGNYLRVLKANLP